MLNEIPKWEDLQKSTAERNRTSPYASTPASASINTRYKRHNNTDLRSERHRENSNDNLLNSPRSPLPGSTNLSGVADAQTWQLGDLWPLDGTRYLSTTEIQTKDPATTRSYLTEKRAAGFGSTTRTRKTGSLRKGKTTTRENRTEED
ncbi:hypothetical protein BGW37DRAFT_518738 [Umbelopsis sp. PMI_123]|nr:hypothetical protein BGW37DRAFT_518738 [Umbelopsis sp. PMI_123]